MKFLFVFILIQFYKECKAIGVKEHIVANTKNRTTYSLPHQAVQDVWMSESGPLRILAVYEGAVARIYCRLAGENVTWLYAESIKNHTFTKIQQKGRTVIQNRSISIYRVAEADAGAYRCQNGDKLDYLTILEVVDNDAYTVVNNSIEALRNFSQSVGQELSVFSVWSQWSECSACGKAGRRRRFGMCYVKPNNSSRFTAFPEGIPCRSRHLPDQIRNASTVRLRNNEIMIEACKVQYKEEIFELRSSSGVLLETANNTAGIYSLAQELPPQPPPLAQNIMFVARGQSIAVKCPGTTLRDVAVSWRAGSEPVYPAVAATSAGRLAVDARDRLAITYVMYEDDNLYSCWERDNLAGTVKLAVWAGGQLQWNHHTVLVAVLIVGVVLLRFAQRML